MHVHAMVVTALAIVLMTFSVHIAAPTMFMAMVLPSYAVVCGRGHALALGLVYLLAAIAVLVAPMAGIMIPKYFPTPLLAQILTAAVALTGIILPVSLVFDHVRKAVKDVEFENQQRRLAEEELKKSEAQSRNLMENAPFPLLIFGLRDGLLQYGNRRSSEKFGTSIEESRGAPVTRFFPDRSDYDRFLGKLRKGSVHDLEVRVLDWEGKPYWALMSATMVTFENEPAVLVSINDIAQQKAAEESLRESEKQFRLLADNVPEAIFIQTRMQLAYVNFACIKLYGAGSREDLLGKPVLERFHPDLHALVRERIRRLIEEKEPASLLEQKHFKMNGEVVDVLVSAVPFYFQGDDGALVFVTDITERKRIESSLEKERVMLRERVKEQTCLYRIFELTEDAKSPLERQLQRVAETIVPGWFYPEITAAHIEYDGRVIDTPGFTETPWMQMAEASTTQGKTFRLTVAYREEKPPADEGPFLKEERTLINAIVNRLAENADRRHAEAALQEILDRYRLISENSDDVIWIMDFATMNFTYMSPSVYKMRGYTAEEAMALSAVETVAPESLKMLLERLVIHADALAKGDETARTATAEVDQIHKDGHLVPSEISVTLLTNDQREIVQVIGVTRDITQRKKAEEELDRYRHHLEEMVAGTHFRAKGCQRGTDYHLDSGTHRDRTREGPPGRTLQPQDGGNFRLWPGRIERHVHPTLVS